ncbi:hypothetical protein EBX93_16510, partial [bacterium]|nr:hypothetical protein [bacterium]
MDIKPVDLVNNDDPEKIRDELEKLEAIKVDKALLKEQSKADLNFDWYKNEYVKLINIDANTHRVDAQYIIQRVDLIRTSRYGIYNDISNSYVVVFKLYDYIFKKEINYGMVFCQIYDSLPPAFKERVVSDNIFGKMAFLYYSSTNSYISCDGEYRPMFSMYKAIAYTRKKFAELWEDLLIYIMMIKTKRNWSFVTSFFKPNTNVNSDIYDDFAASIKNEGLSNTLLLICWFNSIYNIVVKIIPTHVNENFKSIFYGDYMETDKQFFKSMIKKHGAATMEEFRISLHFTNINMVDNKPQYIQNGIKLMPMSINDMRSPFKLTSKVWREYIINSRCNDLVLNCVCPSFSAMIDWFYIKNSRKNLYDNITQYNRLRYSEITNDILTSLYDAQRNTYFIAESSELREKNKKRIKKFVNHKFKKLSDLLDNTIKFSVSELLMSDLSIAIVSEYVGRTFADIIVIIEHSKLLDEA